MSEMSPIIAELERMVRLIISTFKGNLPQGVVNMEPPIVTVASRGRASGVIGWYVRRPGTTLRTVHWRSSLVTGRRTSR